MKRNLLESVFKFTALAIFAFLASSTLAMDAPEESQATSKTAYLRAWLALPGKEDRFSLQFKREGDETPSSIFNGICGYATSSYGGGDYLFAESGRYVFLLSREGEQNEERIARLMTHLSPGHAYTLLATLDRLTGRPELRLISEYPSDPEEAGFYVYNLLPEPELTLIREGIKPFAVLPTPEAQYLPPNLILDGPLRLSFRTRRGTPAEFPVTYHGGRLSAIFIRNQYNQPTVLFFGDKPDEEAPGSSDPDPSEEVLVSADSKP